MSTRTVTLIECDECGVDGATSYKVEALDTSITLDLCETHVKPLRDLVDGFAEVGHVNGKRKRTATRSLAGSRLPTPRSFEEIVERGELVCAECGRTDFKSAAGLGSHRYRSHGVRGTSASSADSRAAAAAS